ncbi:hypothetical protein CRYUN_Cryun01aG0197600 [Craigia yunnanensis]
MVITCRDLVLEYGDRDYTSIILKQLPIKQMLDFDFLCACGKWLTAVESNEGALKSQIKTQSGKNSLSTFSLSWCETEIPAPPCTGKCLLIRRNWLTAVESNEGALKSQIKAQFGKNSLFNFIAFMV